MSCFLCLILLQNFDFDTYHQNQSQVKVYFIVCILHNRTSTFCNGEGFLKTFQPTSCRNTVNVTQGYQNHQICGSILICRTSPVSCHRHTTALQLRQHCKMRKSTKCCIRKNISSAPPIETEINHGSQRFWFLRKVERQRE